MYSYLKCNVKWSTQNIKFKVINQHKNDTCYVQSLEKDFYLTSLVPLTTFSPWGHVFCTLM